MYKSLLCPTSDGEGSEDVGLIVEYDGECVAPPHYFFLYIFLFRQVVSSFPGRLYTVTKIIWSRIA